jgi:RNA polymerase sigma-70 factor (ECF subfamily)
LVSAALHPVEGGETVARYFADLAERIGEFEVVERTVNGQPGLVVMEDDQTAAVLAFDVTANKITHIWAIRNPEKLRPWQV